MLKETSVEGGVEAAQRLGAFAFMDEGEFIRFLRRNEFWLQEFPGRGIVAFRFPVPWNPVFGDLSERIAIPCAECFFKARIVQSIAVLGAGCAGHTDYEHQGQQEQTDRLEWGHCHIRPAE